MIVVGLISYIEEKEDLEEVIKISLIGRRIRNLVK